ncbi:MAG TPA: insulinase family protein [Opitutus sp.]|nr:insulinase family protein [Opitutus sp.]
MKTSVRWLKAIVCLLVLDFVLPSIAPAADDTIPLDPAVRVGRLSNGLTYYIRKNVKPEKRVELRLAVNTGSVQEDDDQLGLAHLIEHLCFKGTKTFPKADLIHYLQSVGANFGPDINGYTTFDETVYLLTLPTDKPDILANGLKIMRDWASDITFDPAEIDLERGVVVEEWRLGRGAQQRMMDKALPVLFKGSKYATRLPIGTKESIEGMSYPTIQRYYRDWYRPDLMAFIVVGDIDPDQIEQQIRTEFGAIAAPTQDRAKETYPVPDNDAPLYAIVSDRENPYNLVVLAFKTQPPRYETSADYRRLLVEQLFVQLMNLRLAELTQKPNPPFIMARANYSRLWVRQKGAYQLFAVVPDNGVSRGLASVLTENERVRLHGFTPAELERAKQTLLRGAEQRFIEREKTESAQLVQAYVAHFLMNDPAPGAEFDYRFAQQHLGGVTLDEVNQLSAKWITPQNRVMLVQSVEKPDVKLPTEAELQAVVAEVAQSKIEAYAEKQLPSQLIEKAPPPGKIVGRKTIPEVGVTELELSNGVRVVLKPTTFKNDEIVFSAFRPGGQSVFPNDYHLAAMLAAACIDESGVGPFSQPDLRKILAGKVVSVTPNLSTYFDNVNGSCSAKDLESALQLTHLYFTAPRADPAVYQSVIDRQRAILKNVLLNPQSAFFNEVEKIRYRNHPRNPNVLPSDEDWAQITFDKTFNAYRARFGSAAGFTFVFVGAFTVDALSPLLETYLGSLPGRAAPAGWRDLGIRPITGPFAEKIQRSSDPKSLVVLGLEGPAAYTRDEGHVLWSLGNILERAMIDKLRLELGGVYYANVNAGMDQVPYAHYRFDLMIPCSPENVDKLIAAAESEINRIRTSGPTPDEIQKEVETQRRNVEKDSENNNAWRWKLDKIYRDHETFGRAAHPEELIALVTAPNLQRAANRYLDLKQALRFTLYPESK